MCVFVCVCVCVFVCVCVCVGVCLCNFFLYEINIKINLQSIKYIYCIDYFIKRL